ncbi:ribonuclease H-like domain-containing protein [Pseudomassariella vexata]|uniref:ribonuclease H n=1 Tax=Pseudomassariella vexata TaxID=1141098 RepID=A0A1Y2D8P7_9PEZI|nr:ribonuclease H-like domain-containing protein [Pseudomassariella vexata]ORY55640.1 ribonuclease H-like domain-containing protein [Pseudomassariella vexata]
MVYFMVFYVDGGCLRNGYDDAIGAASAVLMTRGNTYYYKTRHLDNWDYTPTNQRAEMTAIIMALEWALQKYEGLNGYPRLAVKIHSDSRWAIGCMTEWIYRWSQNGWQNARGNYVANRDLIEEASGLDDRVRGLGTVEYIWVPRERNKNADQHCREALDKQLWDGK